jgi:hypothetical protein
MTLDDSNSADADGGVSRLCDVVRCVQGLAKHMVDTDLALGAIDVLDVWTIADSRFQSLFRALQDRDFMDSLEDELIVLGLLGPEIRFRAEVLTGLFEASLQDHVKRALALKTGVSVLRTMSQLPEIGNLCEAIAGFCEGLVAEDELRETVVNGSVPF